MRGIYSERVLDSSDQPWGVQLVWYCTQENVQVILKQCKIPRVLIPEMARHQIKEEAPMHTQRPLFGLPNFSRSEPGDVGWNGQPLHSVALTQLP